MWLMSGREATATIFLGGVLFDDCSRPLSTASEAVRRGREEEWR